MERAQNVKRADPVSRSVHALLANQHTVSASDICVNVYKMVSKVSRAENVSGWVVLRTSDQSLHTNGETQYTRSSSNSGLNVVKIRL